MIEQLALPGLGARTVVGDTLQRFYTPPKLARLVAEVVLEDLPIPPSFVIGCSVGGAAFPRVIRELVPDARQHGVDLDPGASQEGLDWFAVRDFLTWEPEVMASLCIDNPPFGEDGETALAFTKHAITIAKHVAFIMPAAYQTAVGEWGWFLDRNPPTVIRPIPGRPWGDHLRDACVYEWTSPRRINTGTRWRRLPDTWR